jgi:toxin FitB
MILLDTNVLSALMQRQPDPAVEALLQMDLENRIAPFDPRAAACAAPLAAERKARGRPVDVRDTLLAGIAIARNATLATRNLKHFGDLPTPVVSPWP